MTIKDTLKRFVGAGIAFRGDRFHRAVLRLTLQYALSVLLILLLFSGLIYFLYIRVLPAEPPHEQPVNTPDLVHFVTEPLDHELRENLLHVLVFADVVLFLVAVIFGYYFSRATLAPIEAAYVRQRRFTAEAAHELRTPLSVLVAGADYYGNRVRTIGEYQEFVSMVKDEARRLNVLSNDLLLLAKGDGGRTVNTAVFDMTSLVTRAAAMMEPYAHEHDCRIELMAEKRVQCMGHESRLMQVLLNVLKNAVDYNKPKGFVRVSLARENGMIVIVVRDSGIGIPEDACEAVFDRFYRVDNGRERGTQGAGLGLSVVRMIVWEHGGTVSADSIEGNGTEFTVRIPSCVA